MESQNFEFFPSHEIDKRLDEAHEFYTNIIDPEEQPYFVSDETTIFDISSNSAEYFIEKCLIHYGVDLTRNQLTFPFWQVLDLLTRNRTINNQIT